MKRASDDTRTVGSRPRKTPDCAAISTTVGLSRPSTTRSGPTTRSRRASRWAIKLEQLYRVWKQLFVRYYATEQQVTALFESRNRSRRIQLPRHKVVYFRDREDYNRSLRPAYPNIGISVGIYVENTRRAYFFAGEDHDERTLYHEATHQLFHESRPVAKNVGRKANFWIIEGIAVYMETLRREDDTWVLGGRDDVRMKAARYRLLRDRFYVPLNELSTYGMRQVQADPRIATLYSQIAGLTQFLVHSHDGRYRDALVAYLTAVYNGSQDPAFPAVALDRPSLPRVGPAIPGVPGAGWEVRFSTR